MKKIFSLFLLFFAITFLIFVVGNDLRFIYEVYLLSRSEDLPESNKDFDNIQNLPDEKILKEKQTSGPANKVEGIKKEVKKIISSSSPIFSRYFRSKNITLSKEKIIEYTNQERIKNNLSPLEENEILTIAAEIKISDMFEKQYFAHTSPEGKEIVHIVEEVNYDYILVGENLAKGDFQSEKEVVEGWMNSPEHRKNILNPKYTEIGVAIRQGLFQGKEVWLAVQVFGTPISVCPQPNTTTASLIDFNEKLLEEWRKQLDNYKVEIENSKTIEEYNQKVKEYNSLVKKYNDLVSTTKSLIDQYNLEVNKFNECVLQFK